MTAEAPAPLAERPTEEAIAKWVVETCLTWGTTVATAYQVAGVFVLGVTKQIARIAEMLK